MVEVGFIALLFPVVLVGYAYAGYPLLLKGLAWVRGPRRLVRTAPAEWPLITIAVAMYNEEDQAAELVESLLALDYPPEMRQILIVSDGSTDRTDEIVAGYAEEGVELLRLEQRGGKTAAENAAASGIRGEIVVNTDASIRIHPDALKPLIAAFADPDVGLASGRDVSVSHVEDEANVGESGYVGYEMWVRDLETAVHGIVGASGCFYAIRTPLHRIPVPGFLSRDFAAALKCEEHGARAVSVRDAVCVVPRTPSLQKEYRRKVRTITRGMQTLLNRRHLLNPLRHTLFAWMLLSHKVARWAAPWAGVIGLVGLALLSTDHAWALVLFLMFLGGATLGVFGWILERHTTLTPLLQLAAFGLMGNIAAMHAAIRALQGGRDAIWEPTRRESAA